MLHALQWSNIREILVATAYRLRPMMSGCCLRLNIAVDASS